MAITVNDPGYKDGLRGLANHKRSYHVEIKQDGRVIQCITVTPVLYPIIVGAYLALMALVATLVVVFDSNLNQEFSWGGVVLALQLLHLVSSLTFVGQDEMGGLLFWGKPVREVQSGLVFIPRGLLQLIKLPRSPIQVQFPGDHEEVFKGTDEDYSKLSKEEREKFVLPIRALTGKPKRSDSGTEASTLDTQMTLELNFYVRWKIEHFWVFLVRIGSVTEETRQLRDSGERAIIQEVAKRTPAKVVADLSKINESLRKDLEKITEDSGVYIVEAAMLAPDLTHSVNKALRDVIVSKAQATQVKVTAEATKVKLTREGEGAAAATQASLEALANGAKALGIDGNAVVDLEKARAFAGGKTTIFIDGGQGAGLMGIGARLAAGGAPVLKEKTTEKE